MPVAEGLDMADLCRDLGLPLLVVARARLGTINHTQLTLGAARGRGLEVAGVVICHAGGALSDADSRNLAWLRAQLGALLVGEIPYLGDARVPPEGSLEVDALLRALGPRGS